MTPHDIAEELHRSLQELHSVSPLNPLWETLQAEVDYWCARLVSAARCSIAQRGANPFETAR